MSDYKKDSMKYVTISNYDEVNNTNYDDDDDDTMMLIIIIIIIIVIKITMMIMMMMMMLFMGIVEVMDDAYLAVFRSIVDHSQWVVSSEVFPDIISHVESNTINVFVSTVLHHCMVDIYHIT